MAANQLRAPSAFLGWPATALGNSSSLGLNAATTWLAFQFVPDQAKTLNAVRLFVASITGTPTAAGCTCDLYSDANGIPNASLDSQPATANPAGSAWSSWTGYTDALTAGTPYWLVFKNNTGTPASNFPTYQWAGVASGGAVVGGIGTGQYNNPALFFGWNKVHSLNSGTAWATSPETGVAGPRLAYSDSTFDGLPVSAATRPSSGASGDGSFGKQEAGVRFNIPVGMTFNCRGIWMPVCKISTPGTLAFKLYQGTTLLATTYAIPAANVVTSIGDGYAAYFSSPQAMSSANNPYRVTMVDGTSGDTSTTRYNSALYTWDSDANSLILKPMDGTLQETVTTDNTQAPPTFADTNTNVMPFLLLGDTSGEFTASGGGLLLPGGMTGGCDG